MKQWNCSFKGYANLKKEDKQHALEQKNCLFVYRED